MSHHRNPPCQSGLHCVTSSDLSDTKTHRFISREIWSTYDLTSVCWYWWCTDVSGYDMTTSSCKFLLNYVEISCKNFVNYEVDVSATLVWTPPLHPFTSKVWSIHKNNCTTIYIYYATIQFQFIIDFVIILSLVLKRDMQNVHYYSEWHSILLYLYRLRCPIVFKNI